MTEPTTCYPLPPDLRHSVLSVFSDFRASNETSNNDLFLITLFSSPASTAAESCGPPQ